MFLNQVVITLTVSGKIGLIMNAFVCVFHTKRSIIYVLTRLHTFCGIGNTANTVNPHLPKGAGVQP